jgi:DMSO/TMAO reductase YedYZ heme-binding membrane subunit
VTLASVGPSALWYLTRSTGAVALVLLTLSVALGIANVGRLQAAGWPRFVIDGVHRNASLLALAVLAVHIVTSLLDPFAGIRLIDAVIPFTSSYRPLWLGLGAFAFDLLIAIALTSMIRRRLGHRAWRAVHWLAYLCWPVAILHSVGTGSDIRQPWMLAILTVCILTVIVAVWARVGFGWPSRRDVRIGALVASVALPLAFVVWLPGGPLAKDWAARAGTPLKDLQQASSQTTVAGSGGSQQSSASGTGSGAATRVTAFSAPVSGTATQGQTNNGLVEVHIGLNVAGARLDNLDVRLYGEPLTSGGVQMTGSAVSYGTASNPALFSGRITGLDGTNISARVSSADGHRLALGISLQIDNSTGAASGNVQVTPV